MSSSGVRVYSNSSSAVEDITPTASPMTIQNVSIYTVDILISGGTVTTIDFSRNGSDFATVGILAGMVSLSPGDYCKITYAVAPTVLKRIYR